MTPWQWWAGSYGSVEYEDHYDLGEFATREEAIAAGRKEWPGRAFHIVEARSSTAAKYGDGSHDTVPFKKTRNREFVWPLASDFMHGITRHFQDHEIRVLDEILLIDPPQWWQWNRRRRLAHLRTLADQLAVTINFIRDYPCDY